MTLDSQKETILRPSYIIIFSLSLLIIGSFITSIIGLKTPLLILNENQILYLYSTSAQVLAGIYGLTLTGELLSKPDETFHRITY
jgi:hypothetical protein